MRALLHVLATALGLSVGLAGCLDVPESEPAQRPAGAVLSRPQALLFVEDLLVVASTDFSGAGWGDGFLTVIDPATGAVLNRIPTTQRNPQRLAVHDGWLYTLNTGTFDFSRDQAPRGAAPGGIDGLPVAALTTAAAPARNVEIAPAADDPRVAAPVDFAFVGDRALVGSGIVNAAFLFDARDHRLLRGPGDPIRFDGAPRLALGNVAAWDGRFLLVDFNTDRLFVFEADGTPWPCSVDLGEAPGELEGAQSIAVGGDTLYVAMTFSGVVRAADLGALRRDDAGCGAPPVRTAVAPLGQLPNHLQVAGDRVYVVHSGDNNVVAYDAQTGAEQARHVLPPGSNPWHVALAPAGLLAVSEWAGDAVSLFTPAGREPVLRIGGSTDADKPYAHRGSAAYADVVIDAPSAGDGRFGDPGRAVNGVRGAGELNGSLDVFSLAPEGPEAALVLRWSGRRVRNGPGADFAVFENGFVSGERTFMDLLVVEVSRDGETWVAFPHDYTARDETAYEPDPARWSGFAGRIPVRLNEETHPVDPFGPGAGGDAFDLDALPAEGEAGAIRREGFVYVRLVAATARLNPDTGLPFPGDPVGDGPDVDGVYARYPGPE